MRDFIKQQLKQVAYADLSHYDETTGVFTIPKYSKPKYDIGCSYIVQLTKDIVNNNASVLATNWNHGTSPKGEYLEITVSKITGKMLYVDSLVYDIAKRTEIFIAWSGWLPVDNLTQLLKL